MNQSLLHNAHVMVVGCGALGNEVLKNLVLLGIGHLVIVDFDIVEASNLNRSILYRHSDVGLPKVEVARKSLLDINSDLDIECINGDIAYDVGLNTIRQMDVVIGCVDSRWARYCIQRLCLRLGKTWVDGGILNLEGTVRVFRPGCSCYACSLGEEGLRELRKRMPCSGIIRRQEMAGHAPTTPIIASIIGAVEAQEAVKVLGDGCWVFADTLAHYHASNSQHLTPNSQHLTPTTHHPKMFYYEGESMTVHTPIFEAWDDDCPLHDEWPLDNIKTFDNLYDMSPLELLVKVPSAKSIILNEPFIDYVYDRTSDKHYDVMLSAHKVEYFISSHHQLSGRLLSDFYQHEFTEITHDFPYSDFTLSQLGIPYNDIIRIRTDKGICYVSEKK